MQYVIAGLTVLVIFVGGFMLFESSRGETAGYSDAAAYDAAREQGDLPHSAPSVPTCATDITVTTSDGLIDVVAFTCADAAERAEYAAHIEAQFEWNYFEHADDEVVIRRAR